MLPPAYMYIPPPVVHPPPPHHPLHPAVPPHDPHLQASAVCSHDRLAPAVPPQDSFAPVISPCDPYPPASGVRLHDHWLQLYLCVILTPQLQLYVHLCPAVPPCDSSFTSSITGSCSISSAIPI